MRTQYVFLRRCGCPTGVIKGSSVADETEAWSEMYLSDADRQQAASDGITVEHVSHDGYVRYFLPKMLVDCPHITAAAESVRAEQ